MYKESLSEMDSDFNVREVARKIGIVQGLEALLTYDPEFDEKGNLVTEEDEINL